MTTDISLLLRLLSRIWKMIARFFRAPKGRLLING